MRIPVTGGAGFIGSNLVRLLLCGVLDELHPRRDGRAYGELIKFVKDRPGHDLRYAIDASKIRREPGWRPKQDHESGFRKTVAWHLENRDRRERILDGSYRPERLVSVS